MSEKLMKIYICVQIHRSFENTREPGRSPSEMQTKRKKKNVKIVAFQKKLLRGFIEICYNCPKVELRYQRITRPSASFFMLTKKEFFHEVFTMC